jgi:hypothetical protein
MMGGPFPPEALIAEEVTLFECSEGRVCVVEGLVEEGYSDGV